VSGFIEIVQRF